MANNKIKKVSVLGISFDSVSKLTAIKLIVSRAQNTSASAAYIVKPHVEQAYAALKNSKIKHIINKSYLSLPDGVSINWAANYLKKPNPSPLVLLSSLLRIILRNKELAKIFPNHSWAADFTWELMQALAKERIGIYIVGSPKMHSIKKTISFLQEKIPGLNILGSFPGRDANTGRFTVQLEKNLIADLEKIKPQVVFIALGYPLQENLCNKLAAKLPSGTFIAEGGTFDYKKFGGHIGQAPKLVSHSGLEWLWRALREPSRFKRQIVIPRFIYMVHKQALKNKNR